MQRYALGLIKTFLAIFRLCSILRASIGKAQFGLNLGRNPQKKDRIDNIDLSNVIQLFKLHETVLSNSISDYNCHKGHYILIFGVHRSRKAQIGLNLSRNPWKRDKIENIDLNNAFQLFKLHETVLLNSISDYKRHKGHIFLFSASTDLKRLNLGLIQAEIHGKRTESTILT